MGWVDAVAYREAGPHPLAGSAAGIVAHMNDDHGEALVLLCRQRAGLAETVEAPQEVRQVLVGMVRRARSTGERA